MLFLATYAMMNYVHSQQQRWLWVSAMFAGFCLGIKTSAGVWLLLLGVMYVIEQLLRNPLTRLQIRSSLGLIYMSIAAVVASPWYVKKLHMVP
jgi:hypothetical protein